MVFKYFQYEDLNFGGKLQHIQYNISFKLLSVSDTGEYIQNVLSMLRNKPYKALKNK